MLVTVDTDYIDLAHNTEVLTASLDELPFGWIVDLEFFEAGTFSFTKTPEGRFANFFCCKNKADFIATIQGDNHLKEEAMTVSFREPLSNDIAKQN